MRRPHPTIIKVCMPLPIHQAKRDAARWKGTHNQPKPQETAVQFVGRYTVQLLAFALVSKSVVIGFLQCHPTPKQLGEEICWEKIWKLMWIVRPKSRWNRCHPPNPSLFFLFQNQFYRNPSKPSVYSMGKTRASLVGQRAFCVTWDSSASLSLSLSNSSIRLLTLTTALNQAFWRIYKWIGIVHRVDGREKRAQTWKEESAGSFVVLTGRKVRF